MLILNALTRGAVAFFMIMCLGIGGLMLRDGIDTSAFGGLMAYLPESAQVEETIDGLKATLQRTVNSLL